MSESRELKIRDGNAPNYAYIMLHHNRKKNKEGGSGTDNQEIVGIGESVKILVRYADAIQWQSGDGVG